MLKKFLVYFIISVAIVLAGCSVGSGSGALQSGQYATGSREVQISNITTLPSANHIPGEYAIVNISNKLDSDISLQNIQINANGVNLPAGDVGAYIDLNSCLHIGKGKTCNAKIYTNTTYQSYLLNLTYHNSSGQEYVANQIISTNALLPVQDGFIYDATQLNITGKNSLSIPFRLAEDYSNVSVSINDHPIEFSCYQNKYTINTLCSAIVKNTDLAFGTDAATQVKIIGSTSTGTMVSTLTLSNNQAANLITSGQNVMVNPDDGTSRQTIYLVNNGLVDATNILIFPQTPITVESITSTCLPTLGATLAPGASCSFGVNVYGSITSGQSSVSVSYLNGQSVLQILYFNVSYINQVSPALTLTGSGSFSNVTINTGSTYMYVNVSNTGNSSLTNMLFNNLNLQNSSMLSFAVGTSCFNGQTLAIGQNCTMVLAYSPTVAESGSVNFIPTATYSGQGGESLTYANSNLGISYSAVANASFVAVGDFGTTISSTAAVTPTWSANINSLFESAQTANGLVINNGTYAVMLSNGAVRYSTQNALFWQTSGAVSLGSSSCGITSDGAVYYICGVSDATTTSPCTSSRPCIESSTNFVSWSKTFQPVANTTFNNIYYFTNGSSKAYIATVNGGGNGGLGVAVSSNGSTFSSIATGGSGGNSNNFFGAAFNTNTESITAWSQLGFNSTSPLNPLTTWTANNTNRPANSPVRAAIFQNGVYTVGNNAGNIFTAATSTGTYTQVFTGSNQINGIAYGNGTYLAATTSGAVESQTGGIWTADSTLNTGNYNAAYFESSTGFWLSGASLLRTSPTAPPAAGSSWSTPGLQDITRNESIGYLAIDFRGNIYSSSNRTTWTQQTNPTGKTLNSIYCVSLNLCLAVGESGTIIKTTNGSSWSALTSGATTSTTLRGIVCQFGECLVVGGTGSSNSGTVLSSTDYTTWVVESTGLPTTNLNAVAAINNKFFAVGNAGVLLSSANGTNWSTESSATGVVNNLNSIACGNKGCVAVGNGGVITFSATGVTWAAQTSGTTNNLNAVAYNGIFIAVGAGGTIKQSSNGTTWATATFPATSLSTTGLNSVISN